MSHCPANGNHTELSFEGMFKYIDESSVIHKIPTKEEKLFATLTKLLELVRKGQAILTAGNIGIPTIHSVKHGQHCGFGFFESNHDREGNLMPDGAEVNFDGGGAMTHTVEPIYSWTYLRGNTEAWGYPFSEAEQRLSEILEKGWEAVKDGEQRRRAKDER